MQITTLPVYSQLADAAAIPQAIADRLPQGWQLSQHQLATYQALRCDDVDVVINTAMTGDGKSLAGMLPLLTDPRHQGTLALFPTNELIQDQSASASGTLPAWGRPVGWSSMLYGARLDAITAEVDELQRPEALLRELKNHRLLLSNPDILHAILQFHYQQFGRTPTHVAAQIPLLFSQLTFDEFHIFETPQVVAVLTGLIFLATQQPALKTLFLSATPSPEVIQLLDLAGFRTRLIAPQHEAWYHHGADPGPGWRAILQGSSITLAPQSAEEWIATGGDQIILDWFRTHRPGARAALIVNSAAAALRLVERLKPLLAQEDLTVEPNTGITGYRVRKGSYHADLLVGTSTVDVGVDFHINLLVFEAGSAGTLLQRLGRLGRHTTFIDRKGQAQTFSAFAAHALVPAFIYARLTQPDLGQAPLLTPDTTYTREELAQQVTMAYPKPVSFEQYTRLWGRFVPAKVIHVLSAKAIRATFAPVRDQLARRYSKLIKGRIGDALREWKDRESHSEGLLIQEAQSFRGGEPLRLRGAKGGRG